MAATMKMRRLVGLMCVVLALPTLAGAAEVGGVVFWDGDGDGVRDEGEAPAAGIRLNANHTAAVTGEDGRYPIVAAEPIMRINSPDSSNTGSPTS